MIIRDKFPHQIQEIQNLKIPLSDGTKLTARLWLPVNADSNPVPAIVEYIPYRQHDGTATLDALTHPYFAGHGYACLRIDIRGSGNSEGVLRDEYLKQEQDDAVEIMAWLAEQPWCTGEAGMIGISWGGFAALQVAARRPPQLKAIITCCSTDDRYTDDVHWMGGCLLNDSISWGGGLLGGIGRPPDPMIVGEDWKEIWLERLQIEEIPLVSWLRHQRNDAFWRHGSVCENYSEIECAVYAVGGWTDGYSNAIFRLMENLRCPRRGLVGPWTHVYPHFGEPGPAIGFLQDALRWWDRWLKNVDNGVDQEPMINVWMQEALRAHPAKPKVDGHWLGVTHWPLEKNTTQTYRFDRGMLSHTQGKKQSYEICSPTISGIGGGEWCPKDSGGTGPEYQFDQREDDGRSLCFETEPLNEAIEIFGSPKLSITLRADRPVAMLAVRLCDVAPDGSSSRVTFGLFNLCHRNGSMKPIDIVPGDDMCLALSLNLVAYRFLPGHRIRLALSSSYWPMAWPSPLEARLSFSSDNASLNLPLNSSNQVSKLERPFEVSECSSPLPVTLLGKEKTRRYFYRDADTGDVSLIHTEDSGPVRLDGIDLIVERSMLESFHIVEGCPLSARTCMSRTAIMSREDWSTTTKSKLEVSCDEDHFIINSTIDAYEGEELLFSRVWDERIPRDHV